MNNIATLERHRVFQSQDEEAVRAFVTAKGLSLDFQKGDDTPLKVRINGAYLSDNTYLAYFHYGRSTVIKGHFAVCPPATVSTSAGEVEYWLQFPLHKQAKISTGNQTLICSPGRAIVFSPRLESRIHAETGCERLAVAFTRGTLARKLAALLGRPIEAPLRLAHEIDLTSGYGQSLARYLLLAATELEQSDGILRHPTAMRMFEQFIITGLLLCHPHNYSAALQGHEKFVAPRDIKRAIDYIQAHLDCAITLADLTNAAGVAGRTLLKHFRDYTGTSPIGYMRKARLEKVREALMQAGPEENVSHIATRWGFTHMSRFAVAYRRRFGESPSETLKRTRKIF